MTTKTKRRAPRGASPDPKIRSESDVLRDEINNARMAVAAAGIDVTAFPTLAAAIRHLDQSATDFAVAADQRTTAKERECERLRKQVMRFAEMLGSEAVATCNPKPDPIPGIVRMSCTAVPGSFRVRDGVLESLHGVTIAPRDKAREVLK